MTFCSLFKSFRYYIATMLFSQFQKGREIESNVTCKGNFTRVELKMSFGRISYIARPQLFRLIKVWLTVTTFISCIVNPDWVFWTPWLKELISRKSTDILRERDLSHQLFIILYHITVYWMLERIIISEKRHHEDNAKELNPYFDKVECLGMLILILDQYSSYIYIYVCNSDLDSRGLTHWSLFKPCRVLKSGHCWLRNSVFGVC